MAVLGSHEKQKWIFPCVISGDLITQRDEYYLGYQMNLRSFMWSSRRHLAPLPSHLDCNLMFDTIAISSAICSRLIVFRYSALHHAFCSRDWLIVIDWLIGYKSLTVIYSEWITLTGITYALSCLSLHGFVDFVCLLALACGLKSVSLINQCVLLKSVEGGWL